MQQIGYQINRLQLSDWLHDDLHKWTWYFNLLLTLVPLYICWKLIDRRRLLELLVYGLFLGAIITLMDSLGLAFNLWDYPDRLLPITPRLFPVNLVGLPIVYMLVYQFIQPWGKFIMANLVVAALFAFVGEPIFIWLNLYHPVLWHPLYSFPIYFALPLLARWITGSWIKHDLQYKSID